MARRILGEVQTAKAHRARRKAECKGECLGLGMEFEVVKGACPDPCDDEILGKLRKKAKKTAKENADKMCAEKAENCNCAGEYKVIGEGCRKQKLEDCGDICIYYVILIYDGECKKKPA